MFGTNIRLRLAQWLCPYHFVSLRSYEDLQARLRAKDEELKHMSDTCKAQATKHEDEQKRAEMLRASAYQRAEQLSGELKDAVKENERLAVELSEAQRLVKIYKTDNGRLYKHIGCQGSRKRNRAKAQ